jgi:membrane protease YdiL (CAAX protease family)
VWLYERTNNLLAPIAAHGVFNAINIVFLYYGDHLERLLDQHIHR